MYSNKYSEESMKLKLGRKGAASALVLSLTICAALLSACGKQPDMTMPPPEVVTMTVKAQPVTLTTVLPGRINADLVAEVRPQVSGIIKKRCFTEGSYVKAGQVLYLVDPAPFQAAYESAQASLARSQANLPALRLRAARYGDLVGDKAVSKQDVDDINASIRQAEADVTYGKAAVKAARINLDYTEVRAPIAGRIGKSNVTAGALVTASQPAALTTIQKLDPIYLDVPQSTSQLLKLRRSVAGGSLSQNEAGQRTVKLVLEDGSAYDHEGTIQFRDVTVNPSTGTVVLRATFPNPKEELLPGMFARAIVQDGVSAAAILVPQAAVSRDPKGNPQVMLVDKTGKAELRPIAVDRAIGDQWLVTSGLKPGEQLIIEGFQKAMPGTPVKLAGPAK